MRPESTEPLDEWLLKKCQDPLQCLDGQRGGHWSVLLWGHFLLVVIPHHPGKDISVGLVLLELQEAQVQQCLDQGIGGGCGL